jgi:hypothetical protein
MGTRWGGRLPAELEELPAHRLVHEMRKLDNAKVDMDGGWKDEAFSCVNERVTQS